MAITVKSALSARVACRWDDYRDTLDFGTDATVGAAGPLPPDYRTRVRAAWRNSASTPIKRLRAADAVLKEAWEKDEPAWPRRLKPFLSTLSTSGTRDFARLVKHGLQPDKLAFLFYTAAHSEAETPNRNARLRDELLRIEPLAEQARARLITLRDEHQRLAASFTRAAARPRARRPDPRGPPARDRRRD